MARFGNTTKLNNGEVISPPPPRAYVPQPEARPPIEPPTTAQSSPAQGSLVAPPPANAAPSSTGGKIDRKAVANGIIAATESYVACKSDNSKKQSFKSCLVIKLSDKEMKVFLKYECHDEEHLKHLALTYAILILPKDQIDPFVDLACSIVGPE
jgi:hypothetical protein